LAPEYVPAEFDKELALQWLTELRSGRHKQGQSWLAIKSSEDGVVRKCCLGVLAEIGYAMGKVAGQIIGRGDGVNTFVTTDDRLSEVRRDQAVPPALFSDLVGLTDRTGDEAMCFVVGNRTSGMMKYLTMINDSESKTFPQIADIVGAELVRKGLLTREEAGLGEEES
jgi:hypothetical protein